MQQPVTITSLIKAYLSSGRTIPENNSPHNITAQLFYFAKLSGLKQIKRLESNISCNFNVRDDKQYTALHYAAANHDIRIVEFLCNKMSTEAINYRGEYDKSALDLACGSQITTDILLANGAEKSI